MVNLYKLKSPFVHGLFIQSNFVIAVASID